MGWLSLETEQGPTLSERLVAASLSGWDPPTPKYEASREEILGCLGLGGCCSQGLGHPGTSFRGGCLFGDLPGRPTLFLSLSFFLPQCTSCQLLLVQFWRLRKGRCGLASHSSPHLPMGRCQSRWAATVGAASGAALLATPLPGQPQERGLQCLPPAPLTCVGVTSGRTPVPVYGPLPQLLTLCFHLMIPGLKEE